MRIIAGIFRGRLLKTLPGQELRPTSSRLRETLFDVLGASVESSVFVDCYAGSGAVGLEALSRGAREVFLIEENEAAVHVMQANITTLGVSDRANILRSPDRKGLRMLERRGIKADFCFLDPPYASRRESAQCLRWLSESQMMGPQGLLILQHSKKELPEEQAGRWSRVRLLTQGSNTLSFYRTAPEE